ncbi:MAG: hypothetical protein H7296_06785 [Bacteroidia bacterium]|nr:hypothetical protein [Bacteroidia bacterium]
MTCGYVCMQCEGSGYMENGEICDYCQINKDAEGKESNKELGSEKVKTIKPIDGKRDKELGEHTYIPLDY